MPGAYVHVSGKITVRAHPDLVIEIVAIAAIPGE
jgi:hypothetical protein